MELKLKSGAYLGILAPSKIRLHSFENDIFANESHNIFCIDYVSRIDEESFMSNLFLFADCSLQCLSTLFSS